jgi:hypothetical protein
VSEAGSSQHHDQHVLRGLANVSTLSCDAGRGVDDQHVERAVELAERAHQARVLAGRGSPCRARRRRPAPPDALRAGDDDLVSVRSPVSTCSACSAAQAEQHVDVGEAEVAVEQHHLAAGMASAVARLTRRSSCRRRPCRR